MRRAPQALLLSALLIPGCGPLTLRWQGDSAALVYTPPASSAVTASAAPVVMASAAPPDLDIARQVNIQVLNPGQKTRANWYRKDAQTLIMKVGATAEIAATVVLKDGTQSQNVSWSSSDSTVAGVQEGRISALRLGVTTILATANLDARYKGHLHVEVVNDANYVASDRLALNPVSALSAYVTLGEQRFRSFKMGVGQVLTARAIVTLTDQTKNGNVIWESSDDEIALIDSEGRIQASD